MSILKTTMSSQMLAADEMLNARVFATNEVDDVEGGDKLKPVELKTRRSKSQKLAKS